MLIQRLLRYAVGTVYAKLRRITRYRYNNIPTDSNGRYFYIKEGDTIWNPGWQPVQTKLDEYACRHGMGYTVIHGAKNGLSADVEFFVPLGDNCEVDRLILTNDTDTEKQFTVFSYLEFCLWNAVDDSTNFQRNFSTGEVEVEGSTLYHKTEYRERRNHYAFFTVNAPLGGFDTSRDAFLGAYRSNANPEAVENGQCTGSVAHGWAPVSVHQVNVTLQPGEKRSLIFVLGYIENAEDEKWAAPGAINKEKAYAMQKRYQTDAQVDAALAALHEHWNRLLSTYTVKSGDEKLDRIKPYLKALKNTSQDESQLRIQYLQGLVAQNTEQRETLTRLMAQGYIDQMLYSRENNGLLAQCEEFRAEIETLKKSQTTDAVQTAETEKLLKFVEKAEMQEEWNEEFFRQFVDCITVYSRNEIGFVLKCGLTLRERI